MNRIKTLRSFGQSIWYDNIQRSLLDNGELASMITRGEIRGVTSNPSIFQNAIALTHDYDSALVPMAMAGWDAERIFWQLAREDIQRTCDLFLPLYHETKGGDGFVSLEVHPNLANDGNATFIQAKQLWDQVKRANLMIKIPATKAGLRAIHSAIAYGINVNVTLIFSIKRYREVMEAYISGLEEGFASEKYDPLSEGGVPTSVASFFISRIDSKVDSHLPDNSPLRGKTAIASAKLAYAAFRQTFTGPRWEKLKQQGAYLQRPLWASTSTKNPAYPDTLYVDELIGPDTVNTVPPQTLKAFLDHGYPKTTLADSGEEASKIFERLESSGISIDQKTQELEEEGVNAFIKAFSSLMQAIQERCKPIQNSLGSLIENVKQRIEMLEEESFPIRLWSHDPSLWTSVPKEQDAILQRLGWLDLPNTSRSHIHTIQNLSDAIHLEGIRKVLLLGMGGSSLAPEVLSQVFIDADRSEAKVIDDVNKGIEFAILDSTDPAQVRQATDDFPPEESIYLVSSKSGGTEEVKAFTEHFWDISGKDGSRFVAITDPGTALDDIAKKRNFRATLHADPSVGGRFSVFTDFGLLPMALMGMDLTEVLDSAARVMNQCEPKVPAGRNPGLVLGALLGEAALSGRNKLTILADPALTSFGSWLEQLIAESTGKQGKGIIVVDGELISEPSSYGNDRLFVYFKTTTKPNLAILALKEAGFPVVEFEVADMRALLQEFYRWGFATATACHILGVNAFDQPDVQDNKERTERKMVEYQSGQENKEIKPAWEEDGIQVYTNQKIKADSWNTFLLSFLGMANEGDYIAINAFLPRNQIMTAALTKMRSRIRQITGCATTIGFGPRYLHSTGQLHKGGPAASLFIQITADPQMDIVIPGQDISVTKITFSKLEHAQAMGDFEALEARGRRIIRLHLSSPDVMAEVAAF